MAEKRKAGRPPGRMKGAMLSVRVSRNMRQALENAARRRKRRLSREVETLLDYALRRCQRSSHIMALSDVVAVAAQQLEEKTERPWNEDQYTSQNLARTICLVIAENTRAGEVTIPPKVINLAKNHPAGKAYPTHLGEEVAKTISALLKLTMGSWGPEGPHFLLEFGQIRRDLERRERK